ncbi:MAG: hypothetical protein R2932_55335 [Caldilineaceae bacterium]
MTVIEFVQSSVVDIQRTADVSWLGSLVTDRLLLKQPAKFNWVSI